MWFDRLFGFPERNPEQVRGMISVDGPWLTSKGNGRRFRCGELLIPSLGELVTQGPDPSIYTDRITVDEIVGDVRRLHRENPRATFQAASQFNLLEMVHPGVTPEAGIDGYEDDRTQGPVCAMACGAGTLYRNYFVPLGGQTGQTAGRQVDCLADLGAALGNENGRLWRMRNGYALPSALGLSVVRDRLSGCNASELRRLTELLRVGIQRQTEITDEGGGHTVDQVYCSALPIGYSDYPAKEWEPFARLVLDATYEATFRAALANYADGGSPDLFLTLVGGGVFRNPMEWIVKAIAKSVRLFGRTPLRVHIVSYGGANPDLRPLLTP